MARAIRLSLQVSLVGWCLLILAAAAFWGGGWPGKILQNRFIAAKPSVHGAWFWSPACHGITCRLCPRRCFLPEGMKGWCRTRVNLGGRLYTLVFGQPAAVHIDPIEKKPIFHFLPGSRAFSIATAGCNLRCDFCQNWSLSQADPEGLPTEFLSPQQVVAAALKTGCRSIAYTYSEPVVFYEYMAETARLARQAGLYNVMISAGYIETEPLKQLLPYLDVVKIDLKGFDPGYYRRVVGGDLDTVLQTLKTISAAGVQLEIVNLVVPTQNDDPVQIQRLSRWVRERLGADTPLFFSRFQPCYRMPNLPPTPVSTLAAARALALAEGLHYVYVGNVTGDEGENTFCPRCHRALVRRMGFAVLENELTQGRCPQCGQPVPGIWIDARRPEQIGN